MINVSYMTFCALPPSTGGLMKGGVFHSEWASANPKNMNRHLITVDIFAHSTLVRKNRHFSGSTVRKNKAEGIK